ncbi:MAG: oligopeptidase A [Halioglobus sp.]|nr:oligopeptidase A [Halioglobus sp.]
MSNPLLEQHLLPPFSRITPEHVEPAVRQLIEYNKQRIEELLASDHGFTWDNLLQPIEALEDELAKAWSPVSHLNSVCNSEALREAYNACLPLLSEYGTWMGQHSKLCAAYQQIADGKAFATLDTAQQKSIEQALRDFRLAGVDLPSDKKKHYGELRQRLSKLGSTFGENVLDATNSWSKNVTAEQLSGLPDTALASAKQAAVAAGQQDYLINLEFPSLSPVLTYCNDRQLREEVYTANCTRASELGPNGGQWDNTTLISDTLELRSELAQLLGFQNYAELSLATKMEENPASVVDFLQQLAEQSLPQAKEEWRELTEFAHHDGGLTDLQSWDVGYYSEKLRQSLYQVSQEDIRPYLPVNRVLPGLFEVVRRLYGVDVTEVEEFDRYHPDLKLFELLRDGEVIARFYLDLYARAHKRGGAWMDDCRVRRQTVEGLQIPVAYIVCNFTPPVGNDPALLSHNELTTLFHEFGHGLHHMLTRQTVAAVSGINGVAWDAVELPSQFLENWCWEREALSFISGHYETGATLPAELLDKLLAAKNFQSGMAMMRQLEFSLFDFRLHLEWESESFESVQNLLDQIRQKVAVTAPPVFNRFQNAFSHIFAGGYAAGYYSYKWAEVLSADAFSRFEEDGIFNAATGAAFRTNILEAGGSKEPMELFIAFRGREPSIKPLLRHCGISG